MLCATCDLCPRSRENVQSTLLALPVCPPWVPPDSSPCRAFQGEAIPKVCFGFSELPCHN